MTGKGRRERYLITGGAGFIGSNFIRHLFDQPRAPGMVVNLDLLTYAGNRENLADIDTGQGNRYRFIQGDINNTKLLERLIKEFQPDSIVNFAAETHVDRSIDDPGVFIQTNINGTYSLLSRALAHYRQLPEDRKKIFRLLHVSTDEVYGTLGVSGRFTETARYRPTSPYSASKAAADHLVSAWHKTYGLPALITNCSNNYGPYQFPEKLIPLMIIRACTGQDLPVYGQGKNIRDWIYVKDHCNGIYTVLSEGRVGETYNIGGQCEKKNLEVVETICGILDRLRPLPDNRHYRDRIQFVADRPGHDFRYALDIRKITRELGWKPDETFASGLEKTIRWYLEHEHWWKKIRQARYRQQRLGLTGRG